MSDLKRFKFYLQFLLSMFLFLSILAGYSVKSQTKKQTAPRVDLKTMILIPAGSFNRGSTQGYEDEYPVRSVWIDSFYIDKNLVTNARYKKFCDETKRRYPPNPVWDTTYFLTKPEFPVVNILYDTALAFAKWEGKRLPTEAEWEKAARGGTETRYFTGDTILPDQANFNGKSGKDKWRNTSPVGYFEPNKFGIYDMAGNVWQWCHDYYMAEYYWLTPEPNPAGPRTGTERVVRGGSWDSEPFYLRVSTRGKNNPNTYNSNVGFRCVVSVKDIK